MVSGEWRAMGGGRQSRDYMRSQVETASRTQLVLMLYDGAIRFLSAGREKMLTREFEAKHIHLLKAQRIVGELLSTLNHDQGGDIAANLQRVYAYILGRVVEANLKDQPEMLAEAIGLLRELRDSWAEVDLRMRGEETPPGHVNT